MEQPDTIGDFLLIELRSERAKNHGAISPAATASQHGYSTAALTYRNHTVSLRAPTPSSRLREGVTESSPQMFVSVVYLQLITVCLLSRGPTPSLRSAGGVHLCKSCISLSILNKIQLL